MEKIFKNSKTRNKDFKFDAEVSGVFDDMIIRSVPLYSTVHGMISEIVRTYAKKNDFVYDLGCSTGSLCFLLADAMPHLALNIIGIDNARDMIKIATTKKSNKYTNILFRQQNLSTDLQINKCKIAILSLTLQFIRPIQRLSLLKSINTQMEPGGVIILFEKNTMANSEYNRNFINYYYNFKKSNHYTSEEINNKRIALENVLIPYTQKENIDLLKQAGFHDIKPFFQWFNFSALIAKK